MQWLMDGSYYPLVRSVIDARVPPPIPDETISSPLFQGIAEAQVQARDPLALTRTGDDIQHLINAVVFFTAALLVQGITQITQETYGARNYEYTRKAVDTEAQAAGLRARAEDELSAVLSPGGIDTERPRQFSLGRGCRGR